MVMKQVIDMLQRELFASRKFCF